MNEANDKEEYIMSEIMEFIIEKNFVNGSASIVYQMMGFGFCSVRLVGQKR